ncbi:MAG: hypothetical protein IJD19_02130 [Ruminococcus sp.]|nr:hypothetical protein [Ruminococcus sp.]
MKKVFAAVLIAVMIFSLCGCLGSGAAAPKVQKVTDPEEPDKIVYTDYEDTLEGLCGYMADLGYAYNFAEVEDEKTEKKHAATGDESEDPHPMLADMIGAERGYKFTYTYKGDSQVLELYYYTDTNNEFYKQIKADGELTVKGDDFEKTVEATLCDNGKYVMIFHCGKDNEEREAAMEKAFKEFHAK